MPRILVVDDEPEIVSLLESFLARKGFDVLTAHDGKEALDVIGREGIDLIVLDYRMPHLDGGGVIDGLEAKQKRIPVILITGSTGERTGEIRGNITLRKPIDLDDLLDAINKLL